MPTLEVSINGNAAANFNIEVNSDKSLVWNTSCTQSLSGQPSTCDSYPTLVTEYTNTLTTPTSTFTS
jgi:hypothetical protein